MSLLLSLHVTLCCMSDISHKTFLFALTLSLEL